MKVWYRDNDLCGERGSPCIWKDVRNLAFRIAFAEQIGIEAARLRVYLYFNVLYRIMNECQGIGSSGHRTRPGHEEFFLPKAIAVVSSVHEAMESHSSCWSDYFGKERFGYTNCTTGVRFVPPGEPIQYKHIRGYENTLASARVVLGEKLDDQIFPPTLTQEAHRAGGFLEIVHVPYSMQAS